MQPNHSLADRFFAMIAINIRIFFQAWLSKLATTKADQKSALVLAVTALHLIVKTRVTPHVNVNHAMLHILWFAPIHIYIYASQ